jgi:hypothetical protein
MKNLLTYILASALLGLVLSCVTFTIGWETLEQGSDGEFPVFHRVGIRVGQLEFFTAVDEPSMTEAGTRYGLHAPTISPLVSSGGWIGFWGYGVSVFLVAPILVGGFTSAKFVACRAAKNFQSKVSERSQTC